MLFLRCTVFVQCFDGDCCCGDDCRAVGCHRGCCDVDGGCLVFMLVVAVVMMVVVVQCPPGRNLWQPPPSLSQFLARPRLVESSHFLFLSHRHLRS